ncbi:MAG: primosomal protein N' [Candidatus Omnitrophica bacterium]|nr:primosomal protein N' [Candidatus Omnitrophota bacterium]
MPKYAEVVFNHPLRERFSYEIAAGWESPPPIGGRVQAQFGRQANTLGIVVGHTDSCDFDPEKIRPLLNSLDRESVYPEKVFELLQWVSDYYFCSLGESLFAAFPFGSKTEIRLAKVVVRGNRFEEMLADEKITAKRRTTLEFFQGHAGSLPMTELARLAGVSQGVVKGLVDKGALALKEQARPQAVSQAEALYRSQRPTLNADQQAAVDRIQASLEKGAFEQYLIHGVTGSGKTEVFLSAIEKTLELGKTALVLVPEIGLTPQTAARYRGRFPGKVEVLHSGLTQADRFQSWRRAQRGEAPVVVGTRSAVFAPLRNVGLIVVDEEHDPSYKQADPAPRYHGRDVAIYRGHLEKAVVLLGSATPSLESYENVARKKSQLIEMPNRATAHSLPKVKLVDMRMRPPSERVLSFEARESIAETFQMGMQSILFLNRRGHSTQLSCRECGEVVQCENCSVPLVWHESSQSLICHYCEFKQKEPEFCPSCKSVWIRARGFGTEQVTQTVQSLFPRARVERIDLDTTRQAGAHDRILSAFRKKEIDILVGTQMVSKGLDMPGVRLVVVVQAETSLNIADFRAAERSFALLTQVAGRAGRGEIEGRVLVQSFQPHHYSIHLALEHNYKGFRSLERKIRRQLQLPPSTRLLNVRMEGEDPEKVQETIQALASEFETVLATHPPKSCRIIGPTPCPLERIQSRYRWQFLIATQDGNQRAAILGHPDIEAALLKKYSKIKLVVDVDPLNLL